MKKYFVGLLLCLLSVIGYSGVPNSPIYGVYACREPHRILHINEDSTFLYVSMDILLFAGSGHYIVKGDTIMTFEKYYIEEDGSKIPTDSTIMSVYIREKENLKTSDGRHIYERIEAPAKLEGIRRLEKEYFNIGNMSD